MGTVVRQLGEKIQWVISSRIPMEKCYECQDKRIENYFWIPAAIQN